MGQKDYDFPKFLRLLLFSAAGHSKEKDIVLMIYICQRFYLSCNLHNINYQGLQQTWSYFEEAAAKLVPNILLCFPLDLISKAERGTLMSLATQDFHKLFPGLHS